MEPVHPRHRGPGVAALLIGLMLSGLALVPTRGAVTTELIVADRLGGVALYGFDPVAYFVDRMAQPGSEAIELRFGELTWRFRNEANRAAFAARPEVYIPRFGGHDPIALMRGIPIAGDPALFVVYDGRVFLFQRADNRAAFLKEPETIAQAAAAAWPKVMRTLVP